MPQSGREFCPHTDKNLYTVGRADTRKERLYLQQTHTLMGEMSLCLSPDTARRSLNSIRKFFFNETKFFTASLPRSVHGTNKS